METVRKGSKGEAVKVLQEKLDLVADGNFGIGTYTALKAFQKEYNSNHDKKLSVDGVCGPATWEALGVTGDIRCVDPSVIYKPLAVHVTPSPERNIKYLVIHYTAGSNSNAGRAAAEYNTFTANKASADFAVDDRDMVQFNPDIKNYYCWAVGGNSYGNKGGSLYGKATNRNCISIEICSTCVPSDTQAVKIDNHEGWSFTDAALWNARNLARIIMKKYGIDKDHVIRHYDVTGKLCPGIIGWNDEPLKDLNGKKTGDVNNSIEWERFKESL